ncbi:uncharacterized protein LOC100252893 [Vitis vinifera]|uniref:uncharacterized protein LOC100252893 n=1 Tax=Vitis vinifera TaxID=29760 RepID=UPI00053FA102|nr:uncharacterized protein LOC100252893 [Vitis vinifera]|eukprot:XP_002266103.2 PREDICTED: uncharacterized protein LOC100252893 [Vitis vinifera]
MSREFVHHHPRISTPSLLPTSHLISNTRSQLTTGMTSAKGPMVPLRWSRRRPSTAVTTPRFAAVTASLSPLDLTEDNVRQVLADARVELAQIFDNSVGITGEAELAELDGPFVKISLRGRFWHKRSTVLARVANYLKQRIPEILEVDIEDEKQLDDSPENF